MSSDVYGWLNPPNDGNASARNRFSKGTAPDGSATIQHTIRKGEAVTPLTYDTRILYSRARFCAAKLRYKMYQESGKWRTWPAKYMALMGGKKGVHSPGSPSSAPIGWRHYLTAPVVTGTHGTTSARNGIRGFVGSENRKELGASCNERRCFEIGYGGRGDITPTGRWITFEIVTVMNTGTLRNGEGYYTVDGQKSGPLTGVAWVVDIADGPDVWARWEMMNGGTPESMLPPYDFKEWYKDFELLVAEN